MPLLNTTEIPLNDKATALNLYKTLFKSKMILMLVLGNSTSVQTGVELADELADTSPTGEKRHVVWIKNHEVLKGELESILKKANIIVDETPYQEIKAFCLSHPKREALSRIHKNGSMDFVRLESLFVEAEKASI